MATGATGPFHGHGAQFYDQLPFLADRVAGFLAEGLDAGGSVVAVARPDHLAAIGRDLANRGIDATALANAGRIVLLDAEATLSAFTSGDLPDRARFRALIGDVLGAVRARSRGTVRVYGEMVDVLWGAGRAQATLELEALWNELALEQPFELLCGYKLSTFGGGDHAEMFQRVCGAHSHVLPTEQIAGLDLDPAIRTTLASLELRARALETEIARRSIIEDRLSQLLGVSTDLAAAPSREDVARIAIERGIAAVGASYGAIWLLDEARAHLEMLGVSPLPVGTAAPWTRVELAADVPICLVVTSGGPLFVESIDDYRARFPESFERIRPTLSTPQLAYAMLPLEADGAVLGVITLAYEDARRIAPADRTFLAILARQCSLAFQRLKFQELERAAREQMERLYREERAARLEADEATRAREEILSVVSHDLRNPLGTIMMGSATLLGIGDASDPKLARVHKVAERIHRQSERMARLIEDLVDFAGIQAGKLAITCTTQEPAALIAQTREVFSPLAQERGLVFEAAIDGSAPAVHCDAARVVQIFGNLVTNALKVTPRGGSIAIGAEPRGGGTVFFVRDTGPGISPEELPNLFERYWRSKHAQYKGAGLGLSIARGLVEAHGGRIWAESELGAGSTFFFSLTATGN